MAVTVSARNRFQGPSVGTLIRVAAALSALGVALSITEDYADFGKWFAVAGVVLLIVGLHRFGRLGPDQPIHFVGPEAPRKKKKKKRARKAEAGAEASGRGD
ncbi:MAG TPA: hypothetical protein VGM44_06535 [Polyangiaceae bacterium]|jgi:hypothetical protein